MSSIVKYVGEQNEAKHGGPLQWPGLFDLPMRGEVGLLKERELEEFFEETRDFHCDTFDLGDADQLKAYKETMDRVLNGGWYVQIYIDRWRDTETGQRFVYLEWAQRYGQITPKAQNRLSPGNGDRSSINRVG